MNEYDIDYSAYEPGPPERFYSTKGMPDTPIEPSVLATAVTDKLREYGNIVPDKSAELIEDLCRGFNECIRRNTPIEETVRVPLFPGKSIPEYKPKYHTPKTLVFSPKTGTSKTLSSKVYISLLEDHTSLVVVPRVADAIEYCQDINSWRDEDYAKCYYKVTNDNPDSPYRCNMSNINSYKCIVLTHAMFKLINQYDTKLSKLIMTYKRNLVVIDERINLYDQFSMTESNITDLSNMVENLTNHNKGPLESTYTILFAFHEAMVSIQEKCNKDKVDTLFISKEDAKKYHIPSVEDLDFYALCQVIDTTNNISTYATSLQSSRSSSNDDDVKDTVLTIINSIEHIATGDLIFDTTGREAVFIKVISVVNKIGSSIVLDATAEVNSIYEQTTWHQAEAVRHYCTPNTRTYKNFTINKATGYDQGRSAVFSRDLSPTNKKSTAIDFLKIASNLVSNSGDKLLVVTYKDLKEEMEEIYDSSKEDIVFTHWGNHIGKNKWSDCNKVIIIGWYYLPKSQYKVNFVSSVNHFLSAKSTYDIEIYRNFLTTQLADDLIQAIMRCSARTTIDEQGNCPDSEVYMFVPNSSIGTSVFDILLSQFNDAKVKIWNPVLSESIKIKKSSPIKKIDKLMSLLGKEAQKNTKDISITDALAQSDINRSNFDKRLSKMPYFTDKLIELGFIRHKGKFIL